MIKILFLIPCLYLGGAEKSLIGLANSLDKSEFDVTVQTLFKNSIKKDAFNKEVKVIEGRVRPFRGNSHVLKLIPPDTIYKHITKGRRYDIICSFLEGPTSRAVAFSKSDAKKVLWIHCTMKDENDAKIGFKSYDEAQKAYKSADKVICVSDDVKAAYEKIFTDSVNTRVLYNVIDDRLILQQAKEKPDIIFDSSILNFIAVGRLVPVKAFDRLIVIHKKLLDAGIKNRFYLIGSGRCMNELKKEAHSLNVSDSFIFLGRQSNPYKYVSMADAFVCSSLSEGYSTAATEAVILGVPVITTDCSGMREILGNNEYGIITPNSAEGLFDGIMEFAQRGFDFKKRDYCFSQNNTIKSIEKMFKELYYKNRI